MTDGSSSGSLSFDRAAEYYDRTRPTSPKAHRRVIGLLLAELEGRGPSVDVGVGTGQIALPLHEAGVAMVGVDLSMAMMTKLVEKAGHRPLPLVLGDATALPFRVGAFWGAVVRHVLQLIPDWERAVAELVRVVRPGGVILINQGLITEPFADILSRLEEELGELASPVGLHWRNLEDLERTMLAHGAHLRELPMVFAKGDLTVGAFLDQIDQGLHSWTWRVDEEARRLAVASLRPWAVERFGGLDELIDREYPIRWRAYDLP